MSEEEKETMFNPDARVPANCNASTNAHGIPVIDTCKLRFARADQSGSTNHQNLSAIEGASDKRIYLIPEDDVVGSVDASIDQHVAYVVPDTLEIVVDAGRGHALLALLCKSAGISVPSLHELGEQIGYCLSMSVGGVQPGDLRDSSAEPNLRRRLKTSLPVLCHPYMITRYANPDGSGYSGKAWLKAPNWLLRHWGRQAGLVFPIATSNDDMRDSILNAVNNAATLSSVGGAGMQYLAKSHRTHEETIDVESQTPLVLLRSDLEDAATFEVFDDDANNYLPMDFKQPFSVSVYDDPAMVESAIFSINGINPRASALLRSAIHEGKHATENADAKTRSLRLEVVKAQKETEEAHRLFDSIRSMRDKPDFSEATDGEQVEICGRGFPSFNSALSPKRIDGYNLEAWKATVKMGHRPEDCESYDAADLLDSITYDRCVRLVGAPGTGKTSVVRELAARIGVPYFVITCHRDLPDEQFFGCYQIIDGEQVWVDGEFTQAMRCNEPLSFCAIEEGDHLDATKQSKMHAPLNGDEFAPGNGELLPVPVGMRFIMTANTSGHGDLTGRHGAAMTSDSAFNSRWKSTFHVDYLEPEDEAVLLIQCGLAIEEAKQVVAFAAASRCTGDDGMSEPVCLRHTLSYASMRGRGVSPRRAFGLSVIGHLSEYDRKPCNELAIAHVSAISGS